MVKKILFTIAVVAFLTASVRAIDPKYTEKWDGMWPYEYLYVEVCTIPVLMDVGYFVQIKDCQDRKIKMKQVLCTSIGQKADEFPCYDGCETFKIRSNFEAKLGGKLINRIGWFDAGDDKVYYVSVGAGQEPDIIPPVTSSIDWYERKVCVKAWKIQIWNAGVQGDEIKVADLQITVKPTQEPWWEGQ